MAFLKACYTRSETYTPNLILFAGASGDQVETEQTARSPVKYLDAEPKYPPDTPPPRKQTHAKTTTTTTTPSCSVRESADPLHPGFSRSRLHTLRSVQAGIRCCILPAVHGRHHPPPRKGLPTEVGASAPVPALPSRSWPEKLHFPDSRPLSPAPSPGDPASAVLMPTKCPGQLHTPRTLGQVPGTGPGFLPLPQPRTPRSGRTPQAN